MNLDSATLERIVGDVLKELSAPTSSAPANAVEANDGPELKIVETVITAGLLEEKAAGRRAIGISNRAVLTPSARDYIRDHQITVRRTAATTTRATKRTSEKFIILTNHESLKDLAGEVPQELAGSTNEAANQAISAICRGEADRITIFTDKPHAAACQANRNDAVKAAVATDANQVREVLTQLQTNVWCINPAALSRFELIQLRKAIIATHYPLPTTH